MEQVAMHESEGPRVTFESNRKGKGAMSGWIVFIVDFLAVMFTVGWYFCGRGQ